MAYIRLRNDDPSAPSSTLWPNGVVPYELDLSVTSDMDRAATAQAAILEWTGKSEVRFVPHTTEPGWVRFRYDQSSNGGHYRPVGNQGRRNDLVSNLFEDWHHLTHEIGHVLAFMHEHQRPDRNDFVTPLMTNVERYEIIPEVAGVDVVHGPYDCRSINHYPPDPGLALKDGGCAGFGGDWGVSPGDVAAVRHFYGLPAGRAVLHAGSAVSRHADQLDVFTRAHDGGLWTAWWNRHEAAGAWQGWRRLVDGVGVGMSPVTAVARDADHLRVFIRGSNNGIYTAWWDGSWHGWSRIGAAEDWTLGAVTAVSRTSSTIDAFVRGADQRVRHADWTTKRLGAGWSSWSSVRSGVATSDVTAVSRRSDLLDIFVRGVDGRVWSAAWDGGWRAWRPLGGPVTALGSNVAAASRTSDSLDAVAVDERGAVMACGWDGGINGGAWQAWRPVRSGIAAPGTSPVVVARRPDQLDVFVIGQDHRVWTAWRHGTHAGASWRGWKPLMDRKAVRGSELAAVSRSEDQLDVFLLGTDGGTYTATWNQHVADGAWQGWWPVVP